MFGQEFCSSLIWHARCGSFSAGSSCVLSRLDTETFQEKSVRLLPESSFAWSYSSTFRPGVVLIGLTLFEALNPGDGNLQF